MASRSQVHQSKVVGSVWLRNGGSYECYEALVPIECGSCGNTIQPGEKFTRLLMLGGGRVRVPHCVECEPHLTQDVSAGNRDSTRFKGGRL